MIPVAGNLILSSDICTDVHIHTHNFKNLKNYYIYLFMCMYVPVYVWASMGRSEDSVKELVLSFGHVGLGN